MLVTTLLVRITGKGVSSKEMNLKLLSLTAISKHIPTFSRVNWLLLNKGLKSIAKQISYKDLVTKY